jgi:outer membrane lipoprotein SlyB
MDTHTSKRWLHGLAGALALICLPATAQDLFVYPAKGQSNEQLASDRYECHRWAVTETNFDPSDFGQVAPPRVVRVPAPENQAEGATAKGAIAGAIAGAVLGHGDDKLHDVVTGAAVGAIAGAAVETSGQLEAEGKARDDAQRQADELAHSKAEQSLRRANYRRALTACLEGRGYTVR